jgi:hypothetical protein
MYCSIIHNKPAQQPNCLESATLSLFEFNIPDDNFDGKALLTERYITINSSGLQSLQKPTLQGIECYDYSWAFRCDTILWSAVYNMYCYPQLITYYIDACCMAVVNIKVTSVLISEPMHTFCFDSHLNCALCNNYNTPKCAVYVFTP